jgi:hypothetical protein
MSTIRRIATSLLSLSLLATSLGISSGTAAADGWRERQAHGGQRYSRQFGAKHHSPPVISEHGRYRHYGAVPVRRRDNTARNIMLGLTALIVGAMISEVGRDRDRAYHD